MSSSAWASASSPRWHSTRGAIRPCVRWTRATSSNRAPRAWASSAAPTFGATPTTSSSSSRHSSRTPPSSAPCEVRGQRPIYRKPDSEFGVRVRIAFARTGKRNSHPDPEFLRVPDEVAHAREDELAPAPPRENAVVPDPRRGEVAAALARNVEAERVRGFGLAVARDVVELAFNGEERRVADRLRPHTLIAYEHAALGQRVLVEHRPYGVEVVLGRHVEHRVVLVVEAPVRLGRFTVALHQMMVVVPMGGEVAVRIHRHEAEMLEEPGIDTSHVAGILRRHELDDVSLEPRV